MSFKDCIQTAIDKGRISQDKGAEAKRAYDNHYQQHISAGMGEAEARGAASLAAVEAIVKQKGEVRWRRLREMQVAHRITKALETRAMKPWEVPAAMIDGDFRYGGPNVTTRHERIVGQAHALFEKNLEKYQPRVVGLVNPVRDLDNIVKEMFGQDTKNPAAKELASEYAAVAEHLRKRANAAGAAIPPLADWRLPQTHDRLKIRAVGREAWVADQMQRLDWDRMKSFFDDQPIPVDKREGILENVYNTLTTDGYTKIEPGKRINENLASQLSNSRFLHYKDANAWLEMNAKYGNGNAFQTMASYIDSMSRDIAMLEVFGPNPAAMREYIRGSVKRMSGDMDAASPGPTTAKPNTDRADKALGAFDAMWNTMTHANAAPETDMAGNTLAGARNIITSSFLGAATIAAIPGDIVTMSFAKAINRMPATGHISRYLALLNPASSKDRRLAVRSGLIAQAAASLALGHQRFFGSMAGPQVTRRIVDTTMRASLMTPHTQAMQWAWGMEFMGMMADDAGKAFDKLPYRAMFERYGVTAADWDLLRATPQIEKDLLRPDDLWNSAAGDGARNRRVADKFMDMLLAERRYGVLEGSVRGRTFLVSDTQAGTFAGELLRSGAMFKNFPVTILMMHARRGLQQSTEGNLLARMGGRRLAYLGGFFTFLTLAGALSQQANQIASGRDPMDMTDWKFWGTAALKGGGLGYLGDFLFADLNRYGSTMGDMVAGPIPELATSIKNLTFGNVQELLEGKDTKAARELTAFGARYAPGSTLWYLKLLFRRHITDQAMQWADPAAYRRMKQGEQRELRDYNQGYWWSPGETSPRRGPDLGAVAGGTMR